MFLRLFSKIFNCCHHFLQIIGIHSGVKRQAESAGVKFFGIRAFTRSVAESAAIPRLQINRDVENLGADALFPQFLHDLSAGFAKTRKIDLNGVEVQ